MPAPLSGVTVRDSANLKGAADLSRKLIELAKLTAPKEMRAAVKKAIEPAYQKAQRDIPMGKDLHRTYKGRIVAPGFSQRALRVVTRVSDDGTKISAALGVRKEAFYAVVFEELGTSKMPARPWLRPALRTTQGQQQGILREQLSKRIERIIRSGKK